MPSIAVGPSCCLDVETVMLQVLQSRDGCCWDAIDCVALDAVTPQHTTVVLLMCVVFSLSSLLSLAVWDFDTLNRASTFKFHDKGICAVG